MKFLSRSADSRNSRAGQIAAVGKSASEGVWIHYHVRMGNILFISFIMVCIPFYFILCSIDKICWNTLKKSKVLILKMFKWKQKTKKPENKLNECYKMYHYHVAVLNNHVIVTCYHVTSFKLGKLCFEWYSFLQSHLRIPLWSYDMTHSNDNSYEAWVIFNDSLVKIVGA